jgi:hypothetical protein
MALRFAVAALAVFALAAPAVATHHADVVYLQQFKARQKLLADAAPAKLQAVPRQVAAQDAGTVPPAAMRAPVLAADGAGSR